MKLNKKSQALETSNIIILVILITLFIITTALYTLPSLKPDYPDQLPDNYVTRVIDGDTFVLANEQKVRLICVDTPELGDTDSYESKEFLESLILDKEVRLEKDVSETDKYGRLLRYVWVETDTDTDNLIKDNDDARLVREDDADSLNNVEDIEEAMIFVNKELVKKGYAEVYRYGDNVKRCGEIENTNS